MRQPETKNKCLYFQHCYIASAADCFGYKMDCPLYMATNNRPVTEDAFHKAMDKLINVTKTKYDSK